jgi:predicted RNA-binding Zn ribbon-like protein
MDALCLDILHSDWHNYRKIGVDEDRLLQPGWLKQMITRWGLTIASPLTASDIADMQALRSLMQRIAQAFMQKQSPEERDLAALNAYLDEAPIRLQLTRVDQRYQLQRVALRDDWSWVLGQIALSFTELLTKHDPTRIKQCENPACRWIYYDESANETRRWCEDTCANLMRVRKHRTQQRESKVVIRSSKASAY